MAAVEAGNGVVDDDDHLVGPGAIQLIVHHGNEIAEGQKASLALAEVLGIFAAALDHEACVNTRECRNCTLLLQTSISDYCLTY